MKMKTYTCLYKKVTLIHSRKMIYDPFLNMWLRGKISHWSTQLRKSDISCKWIEMSFRHKSCLLLLSQRIISWQKWIKLLLQPSQKFDPLKIYFGYLWMISANWWISWLSFSFTIFTPILQILNSSAPSRVGCDNIIICYEPIEIATHTLQRE